MLCVVAWLPTLMTAAVTRVMPLKMSHMISPATVRPAVKLATEVGAFNYGLITVVEGVSRFWTNPAPPPYPVTPVPVSATPPRTRLRIARRVVNAVLLSLAGFGFGFRAATIKPQSLWHHASIGASMAAYQKSVAEVFNALFTP